mmetsp:Transcript_21844/g.36478  ORF Transcript_21844/g.36478 Transcript_21844/m.36478 type:complete len:292 (-) Transcript_21844:130-1005(-)|eukprot:CAMPEP_0198211428 /NCGR_PEP_ID=MMETSP1445-20131203/23853_1 /TAXON_ID=36898 /ORGANISM="Pyramimonas sp., Strain CCMP2087" /LENGTH=291 /DNA_ID=CAMNT_0043885689 /DNA_START=38 /DNA_END=913 /DNA_ORIENTATION=-
MALPDAIMRVDPADPWGDTINPPPCVFKEYCPKTGYLLTLPFETNCPMPEAFVSDNSYLDNLLKPVLNAMAPKSESEPEPSTPPNPTENGAPTEGGGKKEKKEKAKKEKAAAPVEAGDPKMEAFDKAELKIGEVIEVVLVENSDKLYCCQVQVGPDEVKQVITGLQKHVPVDELLHKKVVVILNLKVAKLAGQTSEAMIMATEHADESAPDGKKVMLLGAPQGAAVGERVFLEGGSPSEGCPKTLKTHFWDTVKAGLRVVGGKGTFDGKPLVVASGPITGHAGVTDGAEIK